MDCRVVVEAAVPVYDVETADEAVRIAISKTGKMLNPDLNYVEIDMGEWSCPHCGEETEPAFIAADEGLVALELEMTVFNVERNEHAARIARKEIGQRLQNIPLEVEEVEVIEDESGDDDDAEATDEDTDTDAELDETTEVDVTDETEPVDDVAIEEAGAEDEVVEREADEVLPEFEDLIDE